MATITAVDVKKLRDRTGAGMMDAKKALTEADGDFDKAIEVLRVTGAAKTAKRGAERTASAGLVAHSGGALVELNSETDFVAKNEQFQQLAEDIVTVAARTKPSDRDELLATDLRGGQTVGDAVAALATVIGEKIELGRVAVLDGQVATYLHRRASDLPPAVGVVVEYQGSDDETARAAAMQVAAMRPQYLSRDQVPADVVANERKVAEAKAREEGKPEQAVPRIVEGRVNGFFKDVVLLEQPSVKEPKLSVKDVLDRAGITVTRFVRLEVGQT
jgi:elongation factor Ts